MRYRKQSPTGDYTFGQGQLNFWINVPQAVAQAVKTTLLLWLGEWYLDVNAGTPYPEEILGTHSQAMADLAIQQTVLSVQGVNSISDFESTIDPGSRKYSVTLLVVDTIYGQTQVEIQQQGDF